jgi:hypothetical protein
METVATQTRLFPVKGRDVLEPTEDEFQTAIITAARLMKWTRIVHFRPARTKHGWQTPLQGDNGFPDLLMIRGDLPSEHTSELQHGSTRNAAKRSPPGSPMGTRRSSSSWRSTAATTTRGIEARTSAASRTVSCA